MGKRFELPRFPAAPELKVIFKSEWIFFLDRRFYESREPFGGADEMNRRVRQIKKPKRPKLTEKRDMGSKVIGKACQTGKHGIDVSERWNGGSEGAGAI